MEVIDLCSKYDRQISLWTSGPNKRQENWLRTRQEKKTGEEREGVEVTDVRPVLNN